MLVLLVKLCSIDEQQFTLSSSTDRGLLKQQMVSLSVQLINSKEEMTYEVCV